MGNWVDAVVGVVAGWSLVLSGCAAGQYERPRSGLGGSTVDVPADAESYRTAHGSDGVRGGRSASDAEELLESELAVRGDKAEADAALASAAAWVLDRAYVKEETPSNAIQEAAQRFGFAGLSLGSVTGSLAEERTRGWLRDLVNQVPKNTPINRYGIMAGRGEDVVIVIGVVEASLEDFPRSVKPGGAVRLKGEIHERYERASVFVTDPDGQVKETPMTGRSVDATLALTSTGVYKLEIMGYGTTGPVVLVNVPVHVGVSASRETTAQSAADPTLTSDAAEAALLSLLNEERSKRGLGSVQADSELRAVALGHSTDMAEHHFFSHVSPTTGTPDDRMRKAGLRVSKAGECVALEASPAGAHRGLLDSPAHRASMLDASFTHVGIGVAFTESIPGQRRLVATLVFGRRPSPDEARLSAEQVLEAIHALRKVRNLPELKVDPVLSAAAGAGGRALSNGSAKGSQQVVAVVGQEMQRQVNRSRTNRASCQLYAELFEREQLGDIPLLKRDDMLRIGVGTATIEDEKGAKLGLVLVTDAGPGKPVTCN